MKSIPVSKTFALVDDEDFERLSRYRWYLSDRGSRRYAIRAQPNGRGTIYMHREVVGVPKGVQIDHVNHDGLDNRKANLRVATQTQNMGNARRRYNATNKYRGVSWDKRRQKWQAQIGRPPGKNLGWYPTAEEAAHVYDRAARERFGEFATLNFPSGA